MAHTSTPSMGMAAPAAPATWTDSRDRAFAPGAGWSVYLILMALLLPTLKPQVAGEIALVDWLNALAIVAFFGQMLATGMRIEFPLLMPAFLVGVGSLIATVNAESYGKSALTLAQDIYLYLWFVMLVNVLKHRGDRIDLRIAWVWAANIAGAVGMYLLLTDGVTQFMKIFGAKGQRAVGLFDGPNSLADFLMMSLFVTLSLVGRANGWLILGSLGFQLLSLIATKSNGGMLGFLLGLLLFGIVQIASKTRSAVLVGATTLVLGGVAVLGGWIALEYGAGFENLAALQQKTSAGRFEQSAEGRERIWGRLLQTYTHHPQGIGPGNSSEQRLTVSQLERKKSTRGKEAHNDFIGYLVERGPLGLAGLLVLTFAPFLAIRRGYLANPDRAWRSGAGGAMAAALAGGLVATLVHSFFMEKLHFRHYWAFLALVYAYAAAISFARPGKPDRDPAPTLGTGGTR